MLLMIGLIEQYAKVFYEQQVLEQEKAQQLHHDRKHSYKLSQHTEYQAVDPVSQIQLDM
jgi:hypothetical protein